MFQGGKTAGGVRAAQRAVRTAAAVLGVLLLLGVTAPPLQADAYPDKPIRFILPIAPGGGVDTIGRIIAQKLSDGLGQPVVPDNRPGAGGTIGTAMAVNAKPDGYTLVIGSASITITPSLYKKLSFDVNKDLAPISMAALGNQLLLVHPSLPVKDVKELIAYAKANPGKLNFSSGGVGNPAHLALELFKSLTNINLVHVPYKGAGPALVGLLNGEVSMTASSIPAALSHIQAGKVKALALLGDKRSALLGNVPTSKEAGVDHWVVPSVYGFLAPAGTPRAIIDRLNAVWTKSAALPETRDMLLKIGLEPLTSTPEQYAEFLQMEIARWRKVTAEANIKPLD
jgi:tripartite-type tricarboxylate transporter receptor subunit TctC